MPTMIKLMNTPLNSKRTVAELKELRALTADENGAQRVAFTPDVGEDARVAAKKTRSAPGRNPQRRRGQHVDHTARRIRTRAAHRRAHGFRAERRLVGWLPQCAGRGRDSPAHQCAIPRQAARHRAPCGLGGRGRRALRQKPVRFVRLLRQSRHERGAGPG